LRIGDFPKLARHDVHRKPNTLHGLTPVNDQAIRFHAGDEYLPHDECNSSGDYHREYHLYERKTFFTSENHLIDTFFILQTRTHIYGTTSVIKVVSVTDSPKSAPHDVVTSTFLYPVFTADGERSAEFT